MIGCAESAAKLGILRRASFYQTMAPNIAYNSGGAVVHKQQQSGEGQQKKTFFVDDRYSTVTDLARLRGWSTSHPRRTAM
jgi:hypothetical protein